MNQQYEYPLPPPPPTPAPNVQNAASLPQRQFPQPPSIVTNLARSLGGSSQTPTSAMSTVSGSTFGPGTPYSYAPSTPSALNPRTPSALAPPGSQSASPRNSLVMEPYNPRQWSGRGQVSGTQMVFQQRAPIVAQSSRDATGMEQQMPSPPPPYSPDAPTPITQPVRASPMLESIGFTASPMIDTSNRALSPQVPMSPSFPPPPGQSQRHRERSTSGQRGFFSLAGLRGKQPVTNELGPSHTVHVPEFAEPRPPAARRAASTGQLHNYNGGSSSGTPEPQDLVSPSGWQPGMPLPGPPPGPPPPGGRSQSLNRPAMSTRSNSIGSDHSIEGPSRQRAAAAASSALGPIPPTPADWVDPDANGTPDRRQEVQPIDTTVQQQFQPLRIDTGSHNDTPLTRKPAKRDGSAGGIQDRRSRSRQAKDRESTIWSPDSEASSRPELIFHTSEGSISRRRDHMRTVSGYAEQPAADSIKSPTATRAASQPATHAKNSVLTPPYTPAANKPNETSKKQPLKVPGSASSDRPISHILHQPVDDSAMPAPLTPSRPPSSASGKLSSKIDAFSLQAVERHRLFVEKEAAAASDEERLELFANFIVHESRLRRDRYSTAYNAMAGDIVDMTRDMWRSYTRHSKRAATPTTMSSFDPSVPSWASDGQPASAHGNVPSSASSLGDFTPGTDAASIPDADGGDKPESRQWGDTFKPSLSPIPSMNVSTVHDEGSSRGRTASRWWEQSNSGSGSIGKPDRIEKSRRETKYMGVSAAALQESDQPSPQSSRNTGSTPGPSTATFQYGSNEYPPEKVGWHEGAEFDTPQATPAHPRKISTPGGHSLDVSRLVTLPPPYPRHHPAMNNHHPLLADLRNEHRILADRTKIQEIKDAYLDQDFNLQKKQQERAKERKKQLRASIQQKIADGSISYADAAQAEADFEADEVERGKADARASFDVFEASVAHPLNTLLTERLAKANASIDQLRVELESRNETPDPNQAQEEGDEEPERLEKLTLLKWLFEAREQLHKEMFDLHADRGAKYSEVILTPYRIAKLQAKIDEATAFFTKDTQERQATFAKESLARFEELQQVVEINVSRGVEDQLSAFWDIAPGLLEVIQHVPINMSALDIQIPDQEYNENPSYNEHPLQYLYSLLCHTEKSAYQFIESQTNLFCLLHEVRTATTKSSLRVLEIEHAAASPGDDALRGEMLQARQAQEQRLTEDLQEKVGEVERQWQEALGEGLEDCKERVRIHLEESGGWEDGLEA